MNQKPLRTLVIWTIWASTALVVYLTLYRDTEVWAFLEQDPSRITWLIMGLFLLSLIASFVVTFMVTQESFRAADLDKIARGGGLKAITIRSTKRAADRFFHAMHSTLERKGSVDVDTLLHVELASYERTNHTIEVVGNLLITLGLIGTVMGLTLTLTGLTGSLDALGHDQEMLLSGLRKAMSGMGTAFYTTLLGAVLGGVILRMFAQITEHGIEGLHDNLMRIATVYCSADYAPTMERQVRLLNDEIRELEQNIMRLEQAMGSSQQSVVDFKNEIKTLHASQENAGDKPLHALLAEHRAYCEMLRNEMHMLASMNKPWWIRLRELFRSRN